MPDKKSLTIITHARFWQAGAGYWARTRATIHILAKHTRLTVIFNDLFDERDMTASNNIPKTFRFIPIGNDACNSIQHRLQRLRKIIKQEPASDIWMIDKTENACMLDALPSQAIKILDTHDIIHQRNLSTQQQGIEDNLILSAAQEQDIFSRFDAIICIQQDDYTLVKQWQLGNTCLLVPHPVEPDPQPLCDDATRIGIVASGWHANVHGLQHFLDNIWPQLEQHDISLHIYGYIANAFRHLDQANIHLHGYQQELVDCYKGLDIVINPVRYGAGLKIKSIEAMAYGVPLVTTHEGASGLHELAGNALLMADKSKTFTRHIETLLYNPALRKKIASNSLEYVKQHLTETNCFKPLLDFINHA